MSGALHDRLQAIWDEVFERAELLREPLIEDGASDDAADEACFDLAKDVAIFRFWRDLGIDPEKDGVAELWRAIEAAQAFAHAAKALKAASWPYPDFAKRVAEAGAHVDRLVLDPLCYRGGLGGLVDWIPTPPPPEPPRRGRPESKALNDLIKRACNIWRRATGVWPLATKTAEGEATAALFEFLARNFENSPTTWERALKAAKDDDEGTRREIGDPPFLSPPARERPKGRRKKAQN